MYPYRLIPPDEEKAIDALPTTTRHPPSSPSLSSLLSSLRHKSSSSSRLSVRKAFAFSCIAGILYLFGIVFPYHVQRLALALQAAHDTCVQQIPSNLRPGQLFKFSQGNVKFDQYYLPFLQTAAVGSTWRLVSGRWPNSSSKGSPPDAEMPDVPVHCLADRIALGVPCKSIDDDDANRTLDVVWTYVNGSDPLHKAAYQHNSDEVYAAQLRASGKRTKYRPPVKAGSFREFDELRYSVRSVLKNFRQSAGRMFVVTSDFPFPGCDGDSGWRLGQLPQWLVSTTQDGSKQSQTHSQSPGAWQDGNSTLSVVHHHNIFNALHNHSVFNSLAIESRLGQIQGVSDFFVYMNDDVFFNSELTAYDFYTKEHGPVFRMQPDLLVGSDGLANGEWIALKRSNQLLDGRFGKRSRPYLAHLAKTLSTTFLHELSQIWAEDLERTASHRFRSRSSSDPDVHTAFLMSHYVVERWREMLLWSYLVGTVGDDDGEWNHEKFRRVWRDLAGGEEEDQGRVEIKRKPRETLKRIKQQWEGTGVDPLTTYSFSSFDGYPYTGLESASLSRFPKYRKPKNGAKLQHDNDDPTKCTLSQECFTLPDGVPFTAAETFKHVAFRKPTCGDCIINAVMNRCGPYGLDAFLPDSKRKFPAKPKTFFDKAHPGSSSAAGKQVPRLPLSKDWESVDFSLGAVANTELSVRDWVVRALHRYRFILGDTPSTFVQLDSFTGAKRKLASVDLWAHEPRRKPAIVCVNDDVQYSAPQVRQLFTGWMDKRWPEPARWEERAASRRRPAKQKQSSSSSS